MCLLGYIITTHGIVRLHRDVRGNGIGKRQYPIPVKSYSICRLPHFPAIFSFWTTFAVACVAGLVRLGHQLLARLLWRRPLLLKYGKYIFFNERKFRMAEDLFNKYGGIAVIICRCLPGVRTFISFPAGVARYPFWNSSSSPSSAPSPGRCSSYGPAPSWAITGGTSYSTTTSSSWPSSRLCRRRRRIRMA